VDRKCSVADGRRPVEVFACRLPPTTYYLLPTTYYLLSAAYPLRQFPCALCGLRGYQPKHCRRMHHSSQQKVPSFRQKVGGSGQKVVSFGPESCHFGTKKLVVLDRNPPVFGDFATFLRTYRNVGQKKYFCGSGHRPLACGGQQPPVLTLARARGAHRTCRTEGGGWWVVGRGWWTVSGAWWVVDSEW